MRNKVQIRMDGRLDKGTGVGVGLGWQDERDERKGELYGLLHNLWSKVRKLIFGNKKRKIYRQVQSMVETEKICNIIVKKIIQRIHFMRRSVYQTCLICSALAR